MSNHLAAAQAVLRPHPASVGEARQLVRDELARAGRADLVETAELLVSEVVTNALVHAGTSIGVRVWVRSMGLRVEVDDGSAQLPTPRHNSTLAGTGRGLRMLQQMVDRWEPSRAGPARPCGSSSRAASTRGPTSR